MTPVVNSRRMRQREMQGLWGEQGGAPVLVVRILWLAIVTENLKFSEDMCVLSRRELSRGHRRCFLFVVETMNRFGGWVKDQKDAPGLHHADPGDLRVSVEPGAWGRRWRWWPFCRPTERAPSKGCPCDASVQQEGWK